MALRNRLSPSSNNSCSLGTNAEVGDEPKSLLTEAEMREHQQESNMVSSYWLYSPQPKQSKSRRSFSDLSAEVVCADAEAARATAAAAQAKADLAKATAKAAQASAADGISSPFKENVATQNFPPNSKFKDTLLSLSKTKISTSTLTKSKQPLKTNEGATSNNLNTDLTPKRVFSPIADEKGDSNTYAVLFPYQSADAPLGITIAMRVAPSVDGGPMKKLAVVSKNPKALPVEVGDVITHVGDEPLPQDMTDPLRLVTNLVRHKRAQGRDVVIFFKRAAAAPALSTPPPKKKASDKLNRRTSSTTRTATAPSPLRALSSPRATGGLHFSRRAPPKASPARTPLGIATQSPNVQANAPSLSASSASTSCSDVEVEKATVVSASSHRETPSCADGEAGEHSSSAKDNKDEDGKQEASPSSSSLEEVMSKYKAHHAHLEHHIHALETSESTADTSADHATAASTREELLADFKAREEEATAAHAALLSEFEASRAAAESEKKVLEAQLVRQEAALVEERAAIEKKVVQASESLQEERAAAEAAFEAHALAAAQDWAQLMQGPLTVGLGEEARQELTQAHDEEMAVAASERVLVLAEMDAVARKTAQERDNKVSELSARVAEVVADRELLQSTHAAFQEASEHDRSALQASFDEIIAQRAFQLKEALDIYGAATAAAAAHLQHQNQDTDTTVEKKEVEVKEQVEEEETIPAMVEEEEEKAATIEVHAKKRCALPQQEVTSAAAETTLQLTSTMTLLKCAAALAAVAGGMAGVIIACHALLRGLNTKPESAVAVSSLSSSSSSQLSLPTTTFKDQTADFAYPQVHPNAIYSAARLHLTLEPAIQGADTAPLPNLLALPAPRSNLNNTMMAMAATNQQVSRVNEEDTVLEALYWEWLEPLPRLAAGEVEDDKEVQEKEPVIGEWLVHEEGHDMEVQYTGAYSYTASDLNEDDENGANEALANLYWKWLEPLEPLPSSKWVHEEEPVIGNWLTYEEEETSAGKEEAEELEEEEPTIGEWLVHDEEGYEEEAADLNTESASLAGPDSAIEFGLELTPYAPVSATTPPALFWSPRAKQSRPGWTQRKTLVPLPAAPL